MGILDILTLFAGMVVGVFLLLFFILSYYEEYEEDENYVEPFYNVEQDEHEDKRWR